jgi:hypothetical protein
MALPASGFTPSTFDLGTAPAPAPAPPAGIPPANDCDGSEGNARVMAFKPVGPVARAFINDRMFISSIMGPYGSAKTTSCFQKIFNAALWQNPGPDGVRRIRVCCVRATYSQLQTNVMKDWFGWFPKTKENWNEQKMTHVVTIGVPGVGVVSIEIIFRALDHHKPEEVFKGMALTMLWLNEVDTLSMTVLKFGLPRVGRYPAAKDGGCAWSGVIADFNAPDVDNWTFDFLVNKNLDVPDEVLAQMRAVYGPLFGISFHRQPGGLSPDAENLENLPAGYYDRLLIAFNDNEKRRFVDNEFGAVNKGQPVYPEFIDHFHVAKAKLKAVPDVPLTIGLDGGMTPAAVFLQELGDGQILVLAELVVMAAGEGEQLAQLGATSFARECRSFIDRAFPNARIGDVWGDPAGFDGGDEEDLAWMQKFSREFGKKVRPAPVKGNRITPRLEAVRHCLTHNVGPKPGLLASPECKALRQGFNNGYVILRRKLTNGSGLTSDKPLKNDFSHVHDALQYGVLGVRRRGNATDDLDYRAELRRQRLRVDHGNDYFSGGPARPAMRPDEIREMRRRRAGRV